MTDTVKILIVEDDDLDFKILTRAFAKLKILNPVTRATNGEEALDILTNEQNIEYLQPPYFIILDINMPKMNGLEFLKKLREKDTLRKSIVFILTTSTDVADLETAYDLNIAGYIKKQSIEEGFMDAVKMIDAYWRVIEFPS